MKLINSMYKAGAANAFYIVAPYPENNILLQIDHYNLKQMESGGRPLRCVLLNISKHGDFVPVRKPNEIS